MIIRNSTLSAEDLADLTESVRCWIREWDEDKILTFNLPGENADVVIKSLNKSVLQEAERIAIKVRLVDGRDPVAEAQTEVTLKRT